MQRQAEILAKKAKLAELKRQRELRQKEFATSRQSIGAATDLLKPHSPARTTESKEDLDNLISRLVGDDSSRGPATPRTPSTQGRSVSVSHASPKSEDDVDRRQAPAQVASSGTQTSAAGVETVYEDRPEPPRKEVTTYSKGVQTEPVAKSRSGSRSASEEDGILPDGPKRRRESKKDKEREEALRQNLRKEIEEELRAVRSAEVDATPGKQKFPARVLTREERDAVTSSNEFLDFVERSSKVIERALDEEYDVLADYRAGNRAGLDDDDEELGATGRKGRRVREVMQFYDERWSKRRIVSDIGFSPKFPELILSAHTKNSSSPYEPPGLIQVWNTHMHSRPEYIFHANSDVLTAKFSPFHPNYILGGTYSGQVLLWDTRSSSSQPMQKTPLTGTGFGHTHPIYSLNIVGTQNAHNIISTSTDGVVCSWSIDMLSHPQEYLELAAPLQPASSNASTSTIPGIQPYSVPTSLSPLTTAFPPTDPSYFLAGTEAGPIHLVHRYDRAGSKAGVDASTTFTGHAAPVMSLDFHKASGPLDLGDLLLSTGLDWSVRLWRVRTPGSLGGAAGTASSGNAPDQSRRRDVRPLVTWQRDEPVYDAKWSPTRPGVWAAVDGAGHLEVWDLNYEVEAPVARVVPTQRVNGGPGLPAPGVGGGRSLSRCAWEPGEGKRIAVGGLDGVVSVFEVGGELGGVEGVRQEEWMGVKKLVTRLEGDGR